MAHHLRKAIEKQIHRNGGPVSVRQKAGALNVVTSTRDVSSELQVETIGVLRRRTQRSAQGDPLSTEDVFYLVPSGPFEGKFVPRDGDLVSDGSNETRVLSVRTRHAGCTPIAYELAVSGVSVAVP